MYRKALLGSTRLDILSYISSMEEDREIVEEVIECLIAHVKGLIHSKLIPEEEGEKILKALEELRASKEALFSIEAEDIHEAIEIYLKEKLGKTGGYLPLGRSRNDHVVCALRLKAKKALVEEIGLILELRKALIKKAEENVYTLMPLFTHLQPAQPSTFAHYLSAIIEELEDITKILFSGLGIVDKSSLGAGAIGGTSVLLDRGYMGGILFSDIITNSLYATSSRTFLLYSCFLSVLISIALSRIAEDFVIFSTPNFGYIKLPNEHLSTSSMMPQKKNPVTMEVARAWAGEAIGHLVAMMSILKALPSGYNLDMQEVNKHAFALFSGTIKTLKIFVDAMKRVEVNKENMKKDCDIFPILATDYAEKIAMNTGRPYREVYMEVASIIGEHESTEKIYSELSSKYGISISLEEGIKKPVVGSPNPEDVLEFLEKAKKNVEKDEKKLEELRQNENRDNVYNP